MSFSLKSPVDYTDLGAVAGFALAVGLTVFALGHIPYAKKLVHK